MARPAKKASGSESPDSPDSRAVALDLLHAVLDRRQALDLALVGNHDLSRLDTRDRAFARLLVTTVLRRLGEIDAALDAHLRRPLPDTVARARQALRLGAAQRLFLGTPAHAAVDSTVALFEGRLSRFRGLANAVLRKLAPDDAQADAGRLNTPEWLWQSWADAYGDETAAAIADAHLAEPPLDITAAGDAETWRDRLEAALLPTGSLRRPIGGDPTALPGFAEGAWWVQDAAAALPTTLFGDVAGKIVIDLCAAPGGKTAQLAAAEARVIAVDRSEPRLARLRENMARLKLDVQTIAADAAEWRPEAPADFVLLDAPCTATGTIRRHPDIAHLKTPEDVARLSAVQDRLLHAAAEMTAPGGRLVYATCSLQPEEGPERIAALLQGGAPLDIDPVDPAELPGLADALQEDGTVRTLPCHWAEKGGLDGFFIARLRRR